MDLNSTGHIALPTGNTGNISGCVVTGGTGTAGGAVEAIGNLIISSSIISGNRASYGGGIITKSGNTTIINCVVSGNTTGGSWNVGNDIFTSNGVTVVSDSFIDQCGIDSGTIALGGNCSVGYIIKRNNNATGKVIISSGAIITLLKNSPQGSGTICPNGQIIISQNCQFSLVSSNAQTISFNGIGADIVATYITPQCVIYGATVTVPSDNSYSYTIHTTNGDVTVNKSNSPYVIPGGVTGW